MFLQTEVYPYLKLLIFHHVTIHLMQVFLFTSFCVLSLGDVISLGPESIDILENCTFSNSKCLGVGYGIGGANCANTTYFSTFLYGNIFLNNAAQIGSV